MLQPRSKVYGAADHRVVHAVLATEIADRAISGVNADPATQRRLDTTVAPFLRQFTDALLHGDRHLDAASASSFTPSVVGSPKNMTMASPTYLSTVAPYC